MEEVDHKEKKELDRFRKSTILSLLCTLLTLLACWKWPRRLPRDFVKTVMDKLSQAPIAHRGGDPENTIVAFQKAQADGAEAVEVDVAFTRDCHFVLLHDTTVDRTTNGTGEIANMSLEEVRQLDVVGGDHGQQICVPTLQEALKEAQERNLLLIVDFKPTSKVSLQRLTEIFEADASLYQNVVIVSFNLDFLLQLRMSDPKIMVGLCTWERFITHYYTSGNSRFETWWSGWLASLIQTVLYQTLLILAQWPIGVPILLPEKNDVLSGRFDVEKYRAKGMGVITWTVNNVLEKRRCSDVLQIPYMTDYVKET